MPPPPSHTVRDRRRTAPEDTGTPYPKRSGRGLASVPMNATPHIRAGLAVGVTALALLSTGCAKQQVSCAHFAHEHGVPSVLRHALLAESHHKHGNCVVSEPANKRT